MPPTLTRACLSQHDQEVLDSIFNPLELTSSVAHAINPDADAELLDVEPQADSAQLMESKRLEIDAVKLAEQGKLQQALQRFAEALLVAPQRASIYNNRAQALRLAGRDDEALNDLHKAIALSDHNLKLTRCHALCQRGVLQRKREHVDAARVDFEAAAQLGSKFARTQLVEINPYAALCNQMLRQAFEQLK